MELSENLKFRIDPQAGDSAQDRAGRTPNAPLAGTDSGHGDFNPSHLPEDAESQMRKALGLLGETSRHRTEADRSEQQARGGGGFNGGLHRRRFVQDGDVPVTVLRRDPGHEPQVHRSVAAAVAPTTSRLQRTEAALTAETAARDKAERLLSETQAIVRDLQTKIGHAELAKTEAMEALRRDRDQIAQYREMAEAADARLQEAEARAQAAEETAATCQEQLEDERQARKAAEKALRTAEAARELAEQRLRTLSDAQPTHAAPDAVRPVSANTGRATTARSPAAQPPRTDATARPGPARPDRARSDIPRGAKPKASGRPKPLAEPEVVAATSRRGRATLEAVAEPEPVKWWLNTKPAAKKR